MNNLDVQDSLEKKENEKESLYFARNGKKEEDGFLVKSLSLDEEYDVVRSIN